MAITPKSFSKDSLQSLAALLLSLITAWFLWNSRLLFPFKLFVVLIHEMSHGLMALVTGGHIVRLNISPDESGFALTSGGSNFLILNAGYLGSALFGAGLLCLTAYPTIQRRILGVIGAVVALATIFFVRTWFAFIYTIIVGLLFLFLAAKAPATISAMLVRFLAVCSSLYAIMDIRSDIVHFGAQNTTSDAAMLAQATHIPALIWGLLWLALSGVCLYEAVKFVLGKSIESEEGALAPKG